MHLTVLLAVSPLSGISSVIAAMRSSPDNAGDPSRDNGNALTDCTSV